MTKAELIALLADAPDDATICVYDDKDGMLLDMFTIENHLTQNNPYTDVYHGLDAPLIIINITQGGDNEIMARWKARPSQPR